MMRKVSTDAGVRSLPVFIITTFLLMTLFPWIYFVYPHINPLGIAFVTGLGTAFLLLPKSWNSVMIATATAALLVIPTNIVSHMAAHLLLIGCYD